MSVSLHDTLCCSHLYGAMCGVIIEYRVIKYCLVSQPYNVQTEKFKFCFTLFRNQHVSSTSIQLDGRVQATSAPNVTPGFVSPRIVGWMDTISRTAASGLPNSRSCCPSRFLSSGRLWRHGRRRIRRTAWTCSWLSLDPHAPQTRLSF